MQQWDATFPFTVTPAASLLSGCVSCRLVSQEELDSVFSGHSPAFSSLLHKTEQRIKLQKELDEVQLQVELLTIEQKSSDVTHSVFLSERHRALQTFNLHLQEVLKGASALRQRLMKPLGRTNLPVQAHLHKSVVELVSMMPDFMETLEEKLNIIREQPTSADQLTQLNASLAHLLAQVAEVETLSSQLLEWKEMGSSLMSDSST